MAEWVQDSVSVGVQLRVGGGYGSTGVTIDDDGNIDMNGDLTVDGTITAGGVPVGGSTPSPGSLIFLWQNMS